VSSTPSPLCVGVTGRGRCQHEAVYLVGHAPACDVHLAQVVKRQLRDGRHEVLVRMFRDEDEMAALARIQELHAAGASLRQIAAALAGEGYSTKRGGRWHPETVGLVIRQLGS
jgi:hypothetical protein